ncbi:stage II sporulation protein E [Neobacillus sp. OS1-32]|jgi:stage II sporulation protein E|uniref:Stage II sporulation protein E n=1 Tax=Neobacillus paridis TaxID=2803862 RepID=A0ABS1TWB0_9BACI|nr:MULTISPECIES: stage II sporulation protein E [Neobacillus]MBL4954195.1 stage II sporulation protein E [Neobacillus paridis]WML29472.1 stage II sporulation protein E [Neobacillus sp. OS1-32]
MGKVEQELIESPGEVNFQTTEMAFQKIMRKIQFQLESFFIRKGILLLMIGFLLGRALILAKLTPFSLPFFASVYVIKKDRAPLALIGLITGAATLSLANAAFTFTITIFFLIVFRISQKWLKNEMKALPFYVAAILGVGKWAESFILFHQLTIYNGMMVGVQACLAFILTLIFLQSIPLFTLYKRRQLLKTEEIVCLIIMLASIMTGTIGWKLYDLSIEHILARYLVMIFAFIAGATVGSTVGVVTGLIFTLASISSFYHMSLLAFTGVLGGLLKEGKKVGVSFGLLIATLLIGMYGEGGGSVKLMLLESAAAIGLFLLTPRALTSRLAKYIPGTPEYTAEQQKYMRKMRDVTAHRVSQFSSVFDALSKSFSQMELLSKEDEGQRELDYFMGNVTAKTCQNCFKKEQCWAKNFATTYTAMEEVIHEMDQNDGSISLRVSREWEKLCSRPKKVYDTISQELTFFQASKKLKRKVHESRKLVADQLMGVSEVMDNFAKEIQRERENYYKQEEQIIEAIQGFGIHIEQVEIYSLEPGNIDIEMAVPFCNGHGECEKLIAPMLTDILGETIVVKKEECASHSGGFCQTTFRSSKAFVVETGFAHAAKDGGLISGDSYSTIELGFGKYALAISDGMGNGERAHYESKETLQLLQKILQSGIEEKVAIKSVNSILSLRTTDEIFSTLDLAMIDLQTAAAKFLKIGSTPSFIKRGHKIIKIQASNLPMGILQEFEVDVVAEQLKAGDLLIMMSDGVFEGPKHVENYDVWMKRKLLELETDDPQEVADLILEEVIRSRADMIDDDMTVAVAKIKHNTPKWASIPVQKLRRQA